VPDGIDVRPGPFQVRPGSALVKGIRGGERAGITDPQTLRMTPPVTAAVVCARASLPFYPGASRKGAVRSHLGDAFSGSRWLG